jgi:hypothetical protein
MLVAQEAGERLVGAVRQLLPEGAAAGHVDVVHDPRHRVGVEHLAQDAPRLRRPAAHRAVGAELGAELLDGALQDLRADLPEPAHRLREAADRGLAHPLKHMGRRVGAERGDDHRGLVGERQVVERLGLLVGVGEVALPAGLERRDLGGAQLAARALGGERLGHE